MKFNNQLYPELVRKYGVEILDSADKTWPLLIPEKMRLIVILHAESSEEPRIINVALDITEPDRQATYLDQILEGTWTSARMFYLSEHVADYCRLRYDH